MAKKAFDIVMESRKELVNKVIENMKNGYIIPPGDWNREILRPQNPVSKVKYRGGNRFRLINAAQNLGYKDSRWVTYNQVKKKPNLSFKNYNRQKGILCEKWIFEKEKKEKDPITKIETTTTVKLEKPICNYFIVYNAEEIDGLPELEQNNLTTDEILKTADILIQSSECPIREEFQDRAYYSPIKDEIVVPPRNFFRDSQAFISTVAHEMGHSTGHPSRLNRTFGNQFSSPEYAKEELRAELSALFLQADLHIDLGNYGLDSHTQYLESWINALQNNANELFIAIRDADMASQYLLHNYEKELTKEITLETQKATKKSEHKKNNSKEEKINTFSNRNRRAKQEIEH